MNQNAELDEWMADLVLHAVLVIEIADGSHES